MTAYDDRRPADDDLDQEERALAARLTTALAGRADALVVADEAFDPTRSTTLDLAADEDSPRPATPPMRVAGAPSGGPDENEPAPFELLRVTPSGSTGRGWIVWVAGLAAAVVLVAAIVMIDAVRQPSVDVGGDPAPLVGPDTGWAPTWVPDGLQLWRLEVGRLTSEEVGSLGTDAQAVSPTVSQLVESDGTRLLISVGTTAGLMANGGAATTDVAIRGASGSTRIVPGLIGGTGDGIQLAWEESGQGFTALAVGADTGAAIALLDGLDLADPADAGAGFAAAPDGSVTVRTDARRDLPSTPPVAAGFSYSTDLPTGQDPELNVATIGASNGVRMAAAGYPGYLMTGFLGGIRPDGVAFAYTPRSDHNPASGQAVWPDGRTVYAYGADLDRETAERVASGVEAVSLDELERRAAEVSDRLGSGAVLARADLPSGSIEVIGDSAPAALCLTVALERRCGLSDRMSRTGEQGPGPSQMASGSLLVDGRWFLFGANEGSVDISVELGSGGAGTTTGTGPPDPSVRPETETVGTWTVSLLVVPDEFERATITFPNRSLNLARPTS